jgi:hypothetical protein
MNMKNLFGKNPKRREREWNDMLNLDRFWMGQELELRHQDKKHKFRASAKNPSGIYRKYHPRASANLIPAFNSPY